MDSSIYCHLLNIITVHLLNRTKNTLVKLYSSHVSPHLDTRTDQEVHQYWLDLGLPRLKVIPSNEDPPLHGQLYGAWHEGVLRGAVDVGAALQNAGHGKQSRGRNLCSGLMEHEKKTIITECLAIITKANAWLAGVRFPRESLPIVCWAAPFQISSLLKVLQFATDHKSAE